MDKVSIIVPCYNVEATIERCIDSLKKQTFKNIEVLLIDDGSKDDTKKIILKNIESNTKFKYIYKENGGVSSARNLGITKATGTYLSFVDSDDYLEKTFIESLYNAIIENETDFAITNIKRIYKNKVSYNKVKNQSDIYKYTAPWNKLYKKELFDKYNLKFPEGVWYEDVSVSAKVNLITSNNYALDDNYFYNYVQNKNSLIHTYDDRIFDIFKVLEDVEVFYIENDLKEELETYIEFLYIYHVLVGTIFRSSFHNDFNKLMIKDIISKVEIKYPDWNKNINIKELPLSFKLYLKLVKNKQISLLYFLLKHFNKFFNL